MKRVLILLAILLLLGCVGQETQVTPTETPIKIPVKPEIKVVTAPGGYLFYENSSVSKILLTNYTLNVTILEEGIYYTRYTITQGKPGPVEKVYRIELGKPAVLIRGTVKNDYDEMFYVALFAYGYDSSGKKVSESVTPARPGYPWGTGTVVKLESGEEKSFKLVLEYKENLTTIKIFVGISKYPMP